MFPAYRPIRVVVVRVSYRERSPPCTLTINIGRVSSQMKFWSPLIGRSMIQQVRLGAWGFPTTSDLKLAQHPDIQGSPFQPAANAGPDTLQGLHDHNTALKDGTSKYGYTPPIMFDSHDSSSALSLSKSSVESTFRSTADPSAIATNGRHSHHSSPMPSHPQRTSLIRIPTRHEPSSVMAWTIRLVGDRKLVECGFPECDRTFSRLPDLKRHYNGTHASEPTLFWCPIAGCDRSAGNRPFPRKDKMTEHARTKHNLFHSN
jgi:hypothetical protein